MRPLISVKDTKVFTVAKSQVKATQLCGKISPLPNFDKRWIRIHPCTIRQKKKHHGARAMYGFTTLLATAN